MTVQKHVQNKDNKSLSKHLAKHNVEQKEPTSFEGYLTGECLREQVADTCFALSKMFFLFSFLTVFHVASFHDEHIQSATGVDFKVKCLDVNDDKRVKLTIWDTAGQERFQTLMSSCCRGAHGFVLVLDVTPQPTPLKVCNNG